MKLEYSELTKAEVEELEEAIAGGCVTSTQPRLRMDFFHTIIGDVNTRILEIKGKYEWNASGYLNISIKTRKPVTNQYGHLVFPTLKRRR